MLFSVQNVYPSTRQKEREREYVRMYTRRHSLPTRPMSHANRPPTEHSGRQLLSEFFKIR